ncbi:hypothetical protein U1Q18_035827 [Sarracenia purpurea var. burkii]
MVASELTRELTESAAMKACKCLKDGWGSMGRKAWVMDTCRSTERRELEGSEMAIWVTFNGDGDLQAVVRGSNNGFPLLH